MRCHLPDYRGDLSFALIWTVETPAVEYGETGSSWAL
jgi:hypothetical protein